MTAIHLITEQILEEELIKGLEINGIKYNMEVSYTKSAW